MFINITKTIPEVPNIFKCRPRKYRVLVQEKISIVMFTINHTEGCWHSEFIALYLKQVTVKQHKKEIYYFETK